MTTPTPLDVCALDCIVPAVQTLAHYDVTELKLIYRVLHSQVMNQIELLDAQLLEALQRWLQTVARREGVDGTRRESLDGRARPRCC